MDSSLKYVLRFLLSSVLWLEACILPSDGIRLNLVQFSPCLERLSLPGYVYEVNNDYLSLYKFDKCAYNIKFSWFTNGRIQ